MAARARWQAQNVHAAPRSRKSAGGKTDLAVICATSGSRRGALFLSAYAARYTISGRAAQGRLGRNTEDPTSQVKDIGHALLNAGTPNLETRAVMPHHPVLAYFPSHGLSRRRPNCPMDRSGTNGFVSDAGFGIMQRSFALSKQSAAQSGGSAAQARLRRRLNHLWFGFDDLRFWLDRRDLCFDGDAGNGRRVENRALRRTATELRRILIGDRAFEGRYLRQAFSAA